MSTEREHTEVTHEFDSQDPRAGTAGHRDESGDTVMKVDVTMSDRLPRSFSDRGFGNFPPVPSEYGGDVRVYESSAAMAPHVWLNATAPVSLNEPDGPTLSAAIHLSAENAWTLGRELLAAVVEHYQGDAVPGSYRPHALAALAQATGLPGNVLAASLDDLHRLGYMVVRVTDEQERPT